MTDVTGPPVDKNLHPNHSKFNLVLGLEEYQEQALRTAIYPGQGTSQGLAYCALGLTGEAGEISNKVKKVLRDDEGVLTEERKQAILSELGDVMWYAAMLCQELGGNLSSVGLANLKKLKLRAEADRLHGEGDDR